MLKLNRTNKPRVSNRLAIFAAVLLMSSIVAGLDRSMPHENSSDSLAAIPSLFSGETVTKQASTGSQVKQKKGFKVSLFLLRID
jgi:hypothetical protein